MFKAKIIPADDYFKLRKIQLFLMFVSILPVAIIVHSYQFPIGLSLSIIGICIVTFAFILFDQERINSFFGNDFAEIDFVEIDDDLLRVTSNNGRREHVYHLKTLPKLILKNRYTVPADTFKKLRREISGNQDSNYLIIQQNGEDKRFEFEIDSDISLKQLENLIGRLEWKGFSVDRESHPAAVAA